jgi:hypothetical protein
MSLFVSALTGGKVPLLADFWATMPSMVKLDSKRAISESKNHKDIRDDCVDKFAFLLGLKDGFMMLGNKSKGMGDWDILKPKQVMPEKFTLFGIGEDMDPFPDVIRNDFVESRKRLMEKLQEWKNMHDQKIAKERFPFERSKVALYHQMMKLGLLVHRE